MFRGISIRKRQAFVLIFAMAILWPIIAWLAARALIVDASLSHADALVVLGGSGTYIERTQRAAELFHEGRSSKIILLNDHNRGGWSAKEQRNPFFVERAFEELRSAGVPAEQIEVLPRVVSSTYDEAIELRGYAALYHTKSFLVVTSAYHSRRALWILRRMVSVNGVEVGVESVPPGRQTPNPATWWLHVRGWRIVAGEYLKILYYWLRYSSA